ncbi:RecQ family ATP-dependent DNA helicase [Shewanella gaetbuli]|uniref:ATP-dependent DNA helicase RecQ n=1 Tax=Shewanella gaetbuli TaxID=220752 RepID=A0A9X1ZN19_9GAMM|nr:RecQ family ATP-dependent DNA helicase [Shewanella gaetbuli]MCL1142495.1 RecQ family ATP-dependent DNA helicase [Shewanella gaetbuli]
MPAIQSMTLQQQLSQYFGFNDFREGQLETIQHVLAGHSSLAIFPTGSGKSLCYQLSAINLPKLTLVISPLIALIQDQLKFLHAKGINAASIDSSLTQQQVQHVMQSVRQGECNILMVSVERFKNERFRQFLSQIEISLLVVDEAHCISEWGHNFRPDYLKIPMLCQAFNIPTTLLLTATATQKVKQDICQRFNIHPQHVVQTGFYRDNLALAVLPVTQHQKNAVLLAQINQHTGCGIVYVTLQQTAEQVAEYLQDNGVNAVAYHAGLLSEQRISIQQQFMHSDQQVIVATIAFGMGIDKSDIRYVFHYDLPKSIENYSQEIGRAGRDGQLAHCVTLANLDGLNTLENFVYADTPEHDDIDTLINLIKNETDESGKWEMQDLALSKACNIKVLPLKTLLVQLEMSAIIEPSYAYFAEFKYQLCVDKDVLLGQFNPQRAAFLSTILQHTQFKKVWGQLDFEALHRATNEPRTRVIAALEYLAEKQLIILETKKMTQVFRVNMERLRDPSIVSGMSHYFKDKEDKEINRIEQLISFFELDSCLAAYLARYFDDLQSPQYCQRCSVCLGHIAKLTQSTQPQQYELSQVSLFLSELRELVSSKQLTLTTATQAKFLAGISVPILGRLKVKNLAGFGALNQWRFADIVQIINALESK